jgi:hypothetical protein
VTTCRNGSAGLSSSAERRRPLSAVVRSAPSSAPRRRVPSAPKARHKVARGKRVARGPWIEMKEEGALKGRKTLRQLLSAFQAFPLYPKDPRGSALRARPWLPYAAPAAVSCSRLPLCRACGAFLRLATVRAPAALSCDWLPCRCGYRALRLRRCYVGTPPTHRRLSEDHLCTA